MDTTSAQECFLTTLAIFADAVTRALPMVKMKRTSAMVHPLSAGMTPGVENTSSGMRPLRKKVVAETIRPHQTTLQPQTNNCIPSTCRGAWSSPNVKADTERVNRNKRPHNGRFNRCDGVLYTLCLDMGNLFALPQGSFCNRQQTRNE